jgi:A/G-specific adenine glycosylase
VTDTFASVSMDERPADFAARIVAWQRIHGRHDLPWQQVRDPYRIWLSEIMLQQTQVSAVIPYYERFLGRFPDVAALATAPLDDVLAFWSGLGYYARARNLHAAARIVMGEHAGRFPQTPDALATLPGIGRSTAAAIAVFAFGARAAILDGNVKRVLARWRGIGGWSGDSAVERTLWALAESVLPAADVEAFTQGLMDLGSSLCGRNRPQCAICPVRADCVARREGTTADLPAARPRKARPERTATMFVLNHAGMVLLERRPPAGIWGGLWSLPEGSEGGDPVIHCRERFAVHVLASATGPLLRHGFTHFSLTIRPWYAEVSPAAQAATEPGARWFSLEAALAAGVPAPVRTLLLGLCAGASPLVSRAG